MELERRLLRPDEQNPAVRVLVGLVAGALEGVGREGEDVGSFRERVLEAVDTFPAVSRQGERMVKWERGPVVETRLAQRELPFADQDAVGREQPELQRLGRVFLGEEFLASWLELSRLELAY